MGRKITAIPEKPMTSGNQALLEIFRDSSSRAPVAPAGARSGAASSRQLTRYFLPPHKTNKNPVPLPALAGRCRPSRSVRKLRNLGRLILGTHTNVQIKN